MRKIICIILFLCCVINSYATEPIAIYRVKSVAYYYDNNWSGEGEYKGVITLFKDKIVNKSETGKAIFHILGDIESKKNPFGNESLIFRCFNEKSKECTIELTYIRDFGRRCIFLRFPTHDVRYIIKNDDEY